MKDQRHDLFTTQDPDSTAPPKPVPAPVTATEIMGAHWTTTKRDFAGSELQSEIDAYGPVVTELMKRDRPAPWYRGDPYTTAARSGMPYSTGRIWARVKELRQQDASFMKDIPATNEAEFTAYVRKQEADRLHAAQDVTQRQQGLGQNTLGFGADVVSGMADPINAGAMILTGGVSAPVEGAVRSASGTMARTMLKEAAVNAGTEVVELPIIADNRKRFGEKMTAGEMVQDVVTAGVAGALFPVVTHVAGAGAKAAGKAIADGPIGQAAARVTAPLVMAATPVGRAADVEVARKFAEAVPAEIRTPDQKAALNVIERQADVDATNPFKPTTAGLDAHADRLDAALTEVLSRGDPNGGVTIPKPTPRRAVATAPIAPEPDARATFMQHVAQAESGGNPNAKNPLSSATGKYQFTRKTWLGTYKEAVGLGDLTDAQIWAKRTDPALQEQLMGRLTANNAAHLHSIGMPETAGNLYLEHFAGQKGAEHILKADPHEPIEGLLTKEAIDANPFLRGKTAGDVIDWAHRKMGGKVHDGPVLARENFDTNEEWADAQREVDMADAAERAVRAADAERTAAQGAGPGMEPAAEPAIHTEAEPVGRDLMPADEPLRAAAPVAQESAPVAEFTTARGSTYRVEDNGATTRDKAPRADAGHEGQQGPQPTSEATHYVTHDDALKLAEFQAQDGPKVAIQSLPDGRVGLKYLSGKDKGKFEKRTVVTPQDGPAVGLTPVETWKNGERVHFGNSITEVRAREPVAPAVADRPDIAAAHSAPEEAPHTAPIEADRHLAKEAPFDRPTDKAPLAQIESIAHDLRIAAESEPDTLFRVGDGETERSLSEILADLDAEDAAIAAVKACL